MKKFIMFVLLCISVSLNAHLSKKVTWPEYVDMLRKYANAFTTNKSHEFASFHGELGEDDDNLEVFVLDKREGLFWIFVIQKELLGNDTLDLYPMTISDTASLYVYPSYSSYISPLLLLYQSPSRDRIKERCETYMANPLRIIDVCGTWLKVQFEVYGKVLEGWLPPEEYISNPY